MTGRAPAAEWRGDQLHVENVDLPESEVMLWGVRRWDGEWVWPRCAPWTRAEVGWQY